MEKIEESMDKGKTTIRVTMHESDRIMQKDDPTVIGKLTACFFFEWNFAFFRKIFRSI